MKYLLILAVLIASTIVHAQPNCNVYKLNKDDRCYQACLLATEAERKQGTRESQLLFDPAIELCPSFDYAYFEKAVPYLKRGDFITWKKLIDKAVELNPAAHLGYRGWCRYQFVRDYEGAIGDIDLLDSITIHDIGYSINGDYHLNVAKALCYKGMGQKLKAIAIIENQLEQKGYMPMPYDFLHLGVLKMETGDTNGAIECLEKSIEHNDYLADTYYYLGLIYRKQGNHQEFKNHMEKAKVYYLKGYRRTDPYTHPMDKIYLDDIETALKHTENTSADN